MLDRRTFLKILCTAGIAQLSFGNVNASDEIRDIHEKSPADSVFKERTNNIIFCQFNNTELNYAIDQCAEEMDCRTQYGRSGWSDILALPYFISIVDRNIVGKDTWESYLAYRDEVDEIVPCIVIDGIKQKEWRKNIFYYDIQKPSSIPEIMSIVRKSYHT